MDYSTKYLFLNHQNNLIKMTILRFCLLLIFSCSLGSSTLFAQKAKFKNQRATVQKTRLPQNYIEPENRTYDLYKTGSYSSNIEVREKGIYGWTVDRESPQLEAAVSIYGFRIGAVKRTVADKETKDKEGNVTKSWKEYTYTNTAEGKGTLYLYGASNPFVYEKKNAKKAKKSKYEEKKEAEAAAKKKALEDNPFLSSEDVAEAEDAGESDINEDVGLEGAKLPLIERVSLDIEESVTTRANKSASAAYKEYREKQRPKLYKFRDNYPASAYGKAIRTLNYKYGYSPVNYNVYLKKMKTEKHPDFKKWNDACMATETLFKVFRYNKSIDANQAKFDPIIAYFAGIVEKIPDNDRKAKKMKKAAFNNLVNTMYYLDRHEELITLCKKYQDSKLLDKIAKRKLNNSDRQIALMAFHKVNSCHLESLSDNIEEGDIETEETSSDEGTEEGDGK